MIAHSDYWLKRSENEKNCWYSSVPMQSAAIWSVCCSLVPLLPGVVWGWETNRLGLWFIGSSMHILSVKRREERATTTTTTTDVNISFLVNEWTGKSSQWHGRNTALCSMASTLLYVGLTASHEIRSWPCQQLQPPAQIHSATGPTERKWAGRSEGAWYRVHYGKVCRSYCTLYQRLSSRAPSSDGYGHNWGWREVDSQ